MILALFFSISSVACSPIPGPGPSNEELYKRAGYVFVATANAPETVGGEKKERVAPIEIIHSLKGNASGKAMYAQDRSGTCSYPLREGGTYLIFAGKDGSVFVSSPFSGNQEISYSGPLLHELLHLKGKQPSNDKATTCHNLDLEHRKKCDSEARAKLGKELGLSWLK